MKEAEENDTRIYYYLQGCYDQLCELETYIMLSVDHKYWIYHWLYFLKHIQIVWRWLQKALCQVIVRLRLLKAWNHYIPVKSDMSDLIEKIEWCKDHDKDCKAIAENGKRFAESMTVDSEVGKFVHELCSGFCAHWQFSVTFAVQWTVLASDPAVAFIAAVLFVVSVTNATAHELAPELSAIFVLEVAIKVALPDAPLEYWP